jgi:hypothetical protein
MSEAQKQLNAGPLEETDLKAERVQEEGVAPSPAALLEAPSESRLKAERVQLRLLRMPGWILAAGGTSIDRVRDLASAYSAADYGTFVLREAARARQKVRVGLNGTRVVVTVLSYRRGRERAIGMEQLDFAAGLL